MIGTKAISSKETVSKCHSEPLGEESLIGNILILLDSSRSLS
jgi:hypothetical protein